MLRVVTGQTLWQREGRQPGRGKHAHALGRLRIRAQDGRLRFVGSRFHMLASRDLHSHHAATRGGHQQVEEHLPMPDGATPFVLDVRT